jgi:hypothetical protein
MASKKTVKDIEEQIIETPAEGIADAETQGSEEAPEVTVTETSTTVTPSSNRTREWMQSKYPDETWDDEAAFDERTAQHLTDTDARLAELEGSETYIQEVLNANPDFALALEAIGKGMPAKIALRRYMPELWDEPVEGDDDFEAWQEATQKFLEEKRVADEEIATRNANLEKSDILLKEFVETNFPTEEAQIEFVEYLRTALRNIGMGELSTAFLDMMLKAYNHDNDVEDAKEAGAIEARNAKITAKRIKASEETDGLPMGGGASPIVEEENYEDDSAIGGILRDYERRRR